MKNTIKFAAKSVLIISLFVLATGCNVGHPTGTGPYGLLYTSNKIGFSGDSLNDRYTSGSDCTHLILRTISFGSSEIPEVARENNISVIHSVSQSHFSLLGGLYANACTEIRGEYREEVPGEEEIRRANEAQSGTVDKGSGVEGSNFTDTVILKDGRVFENVKAAITRNDVVIVTRDGKSLVFPKTKVRTFRKGR